MPFVPEPERQPLLEGTLQPEKPGQKCFLAYVPLIEAWKKERRWITADTKCQELLDLTPEESAKFLAFLEFYIRHVHFYEQEMVEKNGDIL